MSTNPRYPHDCQFCIFLGCKGKIDVYWCKSNLIPSLDSVIGRYGAEPYQYTSSHPPEAFANPAEFLERAKEYYPDQWYCFALEEAAKQKLYTRNVQ